MKLVQTLKVEVDESDMLERYLRLACETALASTDQLAVKAIDHGADDWENQLPWALRPGQDKTRHELPVALFAGWYIPKAQGEGPRRFFDQPGEYEVFTGLGALSSVDEAVGHFQKLLKAFGRDWGAKFKALVKNGGEGDVMYSPGYQLRMLGTLPEMLAVSLCWIEYHK